MNALLSVLLIAIALGLAYALRIVCRGSVSRHSGALAGDPFFIPVGECPTLPDDWQRERAIGNYRRHLDPSDFRAWGIPGPFCDRQASSPFQASACALPRKEGGGRPNHASRSGTAVVLTFPGRRA
jgi:hypothetical protein